MNNYQYILEPYGGAKSRHICPNCNKKGVFTYYIDRTTKEHLPSKYGKCNRLNKCGYHLNPYKDGYHLDKSSNGKMGNPFPVIQAETSRKIIPLPRAIFRNSLQGYHKNNFVTYLKRLVGDASTLELIERFKIGTSKHWKGATVFWVLDEKGRAVGGQVVLFDEMGHTIKRKMPDGRSKRFTSWVHTALKRSYRDKKKPVPDWLHNYCENALKFPCLFGLSQLNEAAKSKPIAIVEAPKTAIIASAYLPEFVWLAVGGMSYLNEARLQAVKGRDIALFPDKGAYERWNQTAKKLSSIAKIKVSNLLEIKNAFEGADLADYLCKSGIHDFQTPNVEATNQKQTIIQRPPLSRIEKQKIILHKMENANPNLTKLINQFRLEAN